MNSRLEEMRKRFPNLSLKVQLDEGPADWVYSNYTVEELLKYIERYCEEVKE